MPENNIKMNLGYVGREDVDWILLAQQMIQNRGLLNMAQNTFMNQQDAQNSCD